MLKRGSIVLTLLWLLLGSMASADAYELLTREVYTPGGLLQRRYTYYINSWGEEVLHGTESLYYTDQYNLMMQRVQYSHGKKNGLDEAWYNASYSYTYQKHWEKEYQNDQLHGVSREWYRSTGYMESYKTYRYDKLNGPHKQWDDANRLLLDCNYQDGLLHGAYKRWAVVYVSGYPSAYQAEDGYYLYGKKAGLWQTWWTSGTYPYYPKDKGEYSNDVKCGSWTYYSSTSYGRVTSTAWMGPCTSTLPPSAGDPLPGGGQFEIRGHVYDRSTQQPVAGALVQSGAIEATTNATGFYSLVFGGAGSYPLNCVLAGYYDFSRTVNLTESQYVTVDIGLKPDAGGGKPAITNVEPRKGDFFIEGLNAANEYVVSVDWNGGQPGNLKFDVNGTEYLSAADAAGGAYTFNMGADFSGSLSPTGNTLKITAVDAAGVASDPEILHPIVIPLPSWSLDLGAFLPAESAAYTSYKLECKWPEEPIEILISEGYLGSVLWTAWGFVPYIGGRMFGIPGTQSFLEIEAKTDGTGSVAAGGMSGFKAAGGEIEIKLGGKGNLAYEENKGLEWKETGLIVGVKGSLSKEVGPVTLIPALEGAVNLPLVGGAIGWFNDRAKIKGTVSSGSEVFLELMSATGDIGFNKADVENNVGIELGMSIDVIEDLEVEVKGGGVGKLFWQVPANPDYFNKLEVELSAGVTLGFLGYQWTETAAHPFTYPEQAAPQALALRLPAPPVLGPVPRDFLSAGVYNQALKLPGLRTLDTGGSGPASEYRILANVYPYADPAVAAAGGKAAVAYVYLDPNDAVHQETEIYVTLFDGSTYSVPAPILNDTRAEFAPAVAIDGDGKVVCVWQRVKNENFTSDLIEDLAAELEIVWAVYDPAAATPAWSTPAALTDNAYLDYNPMLRRGADGSLMLVWFSNAGSRLIGNGDTPTQVHYTLWNGSAFDTPATLATTFANCFKFALGYNGTEALLVYVQDMDGVLTTPEPSAEPASNDQEIFYLLYSDGSWGAPVRVTDDQVPDAAPQVAFRGSAPELVWLKGDALVHLTSWSPLETATIKTGSLSGSLMDFELHVDPSGHLVLLWQDADESGVDLFYSVFDADHGVWSEDLRLTRDAAMEKDFSGVFDADGKLHLVFKKENPETEPVTTDLYHMTYRLGLDLAVGSAGPSVTPAAPAPGHEVTLTCPVTNTGDLAVEGAVVSFYLGDPAGSGVLLGSAALAPAVLRAGESGTAAVAWTIPTDIATYTVYAVVDPGNQVVEVDETNNKASFEVLRPDLNMLGCRLETAADGTVRITATVRNDGILPAEDVLVLFKAEANEVGRLIIPSLLPGKSAAVSFPASLAYYNYTTWNPRITVTADPNDALVETSETNNSAETVYTLKMVDPASQDFGETHYDGADRVLTIFNKTTAPLALGSIVVTGADAGDFVIFDDPCSSGSLASQNGCAVGVKFLPTSLGAKQAQLSIYDDQERLLWQVDLSGQLDTLVPGDVDDDGSVGLADAILALRIAAGFTVDGIYTIVDIDEDDRIGLQEAVFALQSAAGLRP